MVKNPLAMQKMPETQVRSLGREDPLEEEMATHSSNLAWRIPWAEEPGGLQSMGWQRQTWLSACALTRVQGISTFSLCAPLSLGLLHTHEDLPHHPVQKSFCLDSPVSHPLWRNPTQLVPAMPNNTSPWNLCQPTSQLPDPQNKPLSSPCGRARLCAARHVSAPWTGSWTLEGKAWLNSLWQGCGKNICGIKGWSFLVTLIESPSSLYALKDWYVIYMKLYSISLYIWLSIIQAAHFKPIQFSSVQSLSRVRLFATPWIAARQASLSITISRSWQRVKITHWDLTTVFKNGTKWNT